MAEIEVTTVDLLRHGRCEGGEIFRGTTDVRLTAEGHAEMRRALRDYGGWQRVVSSPLRRCRAFAEPYARTLALPLAIEADLREIDFGDWEGRTHREVAATDGETLERFWADPEAVTPPNGEPIGVFRTRVAATLQRLVSEYGGSHLLVVTHGAVLRMALCHWLGLPLRSISNVAVPYAGLTRFRVYRQDGGEPWFQLVSHRGDT